MIRVPIGRLTLDTCSAWVYKQRMPATDLQKTWGKRLADQRKTAGLTQTALARSVGISRVYLARLEAGQHAPADQLRIRLAMHLGVAVSQLFPYDPDEDAA